MLLEDPTAEHRCRQIVNDLALPDPFSLPALADVVANRVQRPIQLRSVTDIAPGVSAVVINMPHAYVVSYLGHTDLWRALTLVAHELGHILCGHPLQVDQSEHLEQATAHAQHVIKHGHAGRDTAPGTSTATGTGTGTGTTTDIAADAADRATESAAESAADSAQVPPALSIREGAATPALLAAGAVAAWGGRLYRCDLLTPHEREAELIATLVLQRVEQAGLLIAPTRPEVNQIDPVAAQYTAALLGTKRRARAQRR